MDLNIHSAKELVENPSFQRIVKGRASQEEIEKWNEWIEVNDQNRKMAKTATAEIVGFEFKSPSMPDVEQKWAELYQKTANSHKRPLLSKRKSEKKLVWMFRIAAILLLVSTVGIGVYKFVDSEQGVTHLEQLTEEKTIKTGENGQKTLRFSNGSKITLNSNSTLTYSMGLLKNASIEVTLDGEAWFVAEDTPSQKKPVFTVSTPDGIIRDIGTEFLVTTQNEGSRVVLQEGLVEVEYKYRYGDDVDEDSQRKFYVKKGEMVEFSRDREDIIVRKKVNPTFYTSWATGVMRLDRTKLREFADYVEQRFEVEVDVIDPKLRDITLDGAVYFKSLEDLVRSVSEVADIPVYRSANRDIVFIGNPRQRIVK